MTRTTTPKEITDWMMQELKNHDRLSQWSAAKIIKETFGAEHTYKNNVTTHPLADYPTDQIGQFQWPPMDLRLELP